MLSFSRIILIVMVTNFLSSGFCQGMAVGCKDGFTLSAPNCQQSQATPCCKHSCCKYTNHTVVSKSRYITLNSPALVLSPSNETLSVVNFDGQLVSHPKIRAFYHPEFSKILRI